MAPTPGTPPARIWSLPHREAIAAVMDRLIGVPRLTIWGGAIGAVSGAL